ncbi:hypothetical protein D7W79_01790 [Corallococcus exercitus]|nr:hypothetical protein D7W79_01790 [Corallococcus exercitus]
MNKDYIAVKVKKTTITRTAQGYFHDLDPYSLHDTKQAAKSDRKRLAESDMRVKSRNPRVPTFYTILQDKRKNSPSKFTRVPQGPHVFPHIGIHLLLVQAKAMNKLNLFNDLILTPVQYETNVKLEIKDDHAKGDRAKVAVERYKRIHARYVGLMTRPNPDNAQTIKLVHSMNKLLQSDPHGTYAYKGRGAGKKATSGKGESSNRPMQNQIDLPKNHGFSQEGVRLVALRNESLVNIGEELGK